MSTPQDPWQVPAPDGATPANPPSDQPSAPVPGYGPPPAGWGEPAYGGSPVPSYGQPAQQRQPPWGSAPTYGQPQWGPPQGQQPGFPQGQPPRGTNGLAIASLVLSIVWLYWIGSILALVFGYVAKSQIKRSGEAGSGLATAGIVIGWIGIAFLVLGAAAVISLGVGGGSFVVDSESVPLPSPR